MQFGAIFTIVAFGIGTASAVAVQAWSDANYSGGLIINQTPTLKTCCKIIRCPFSFCRVECDGLAC